MDRKRLTKESDSGSNGIGPIVVGESYHNPWPKELRFASFGHESETSSYLFSLALKALGKLRGEYEWVPFFKEKSSGKNAVLRFPEVIMALDRLFETELQARFNTAHMNVLSEADCLLVGVDKLERNVVAFGSTRFSSPGQLKIIGVDCRVTHGGLLVVHEPHAKSKVGIMIATVIALYGHSAFSVFQREITVLRINNRFLEDVMKRAGATFRYDRLTEEPLDNASEEAARVIEWTHDNVFHLTAIPLERGRAIPIQHKFLPAVTMDGLGTMEITYVSRASSLIYFVLMVFLRAGRKKRGRSGV